ncbi:MAG: DUF1440 domain-containing protein [Desulfobacteraceae bacterium]|nr:DUF1440 domain-containing protein [Desulfobacteraceae bacterium]
MALSHRLESRHNLLVGMAAGLAASLATGMTDRLLGNLVSEEQERRDRTVREGTAHEVAGPRFGEMITGHRLDAWGKRRAKGIFTIAYGIGWGLVYAGVRRRFPRLSRQAALPFGVLFFAACDGLLAPLLRMSPPLFRIPWQPNAKELANHLAWSATAEMVHRTAARHGA